MNEDFEYAPEIVSVSDDDGKNYDFEVLDRIETDDGRYVALVEYFEDPEEILRNDSEVLILKVTEEDGETYLSQIEDEEEYEEVSVLFEERFAELYEEDDEAAEDE
ncbi:MAG: DUF1292 domain-containing protein [Clostridia bacterium]|nr:DUF1292 domain-containing protein [Clostridia bacterium]